MAKKQEIKQSECRILLYLFQVPKPMKQLSMIAFKLGMDYGYCLRTCANMVLKGWLFKHKLGRRVFYDLNHSAPIDEARELLGGGFVKQLEIATKQQTLEEKYGMDKGSMGDANYADETTTQQRSNSSGEHGAPDRSTNSNEAESSRHTKERRED